MLVSFSVENFKSFSKKETLYMAPATKIKKENLPNNIFETNNSSCEDLLKIACIYGANASGKTKFIEALHSFLFFFKADKQEQDDDFDIIYTPFQFKNEYFGKPITFEIEFIVNNILYLYSISYNKESILREELNKIIENKKEVIYLIEKDKLDKAEFSKEFGESYKETILKIKKQKYNNTFLRLFDNDSSSKLLTDIFSFFKSKINVILCSEINDQRTFFGKTIRKYKDSKVDRNLIKNILKSACNSVEEIAINEIEINDTEIPEKLKDFFKKQKNLRRIEIKFKHKNGELDIEEESSGTKIMFGLSGRLVELFQNGGVLFIDELDKSLHPDILIYLIKLFQDKDINSKNAQLIFTAHNDIALDQFYDIKTGKKVPLLRRDQVYFINKDRNESSHFYSAVDYTGIQSRDSLVKLYRNGFFAARPGNISESYDFLREMMKNGK